MRIGVFDSGIGGEAVAESLRHDFPAAEVITVSDREHVPYGDRDPGEIIHLADAAIQPLLSSDCDVIVVACNTVTAVAIETLRTKYPNQKFIGLEPMVKPASTLSKTGIIAVCATPATLASKRYTQSKQLYASGLTVVEPDCSNWARLIESNELNRSHIDTVVEECLAANADVIILGCTHYHWIKEEIEEALAGHAVLVEPSEAISRRVKELLSL
ncbi:MAG TPA: glutamate racemase [Candidatus Saccharibacteria bacterium]|nr:glutamate racemase [Candidatus Saccharibacteria bacterium]HRK94359.1 glutamate racemase [Candidatus Saccharibacteria bacterium]